MTEDNQATWDRLMEHVKKKMAAAPSTLDPGFPAIEAAHFLAGEVDALRAMVSLAIGGLEAAEENGERLATFLEETVKPMAKELAELREKVDAFEGRGELGPKFSERKMT